MLRTSLCKSRIWASGARRCYAEAYFVDVLAGCAKSGAEEDELARVMGWWIVEGNLGAEGGE
jgi:hypothetical protein